VTEDPLTLPEKSENLESRLSKLSLWSSIGCYCSRVISSLVTVSKCRLTDSEETVEDGSVHRATTQEPIKKRYSK